MQILDWSILAVCLVTLIIICVRVSRQCRGVTGYLVADRCAGRYLLTLSEGMAGLGVITMVGTFEVFIKAGFVPLWWGYFLAPLGLFLALSGFVIYRFRQTRAMTMAEFIQMRYSKRFRLFFGLFTFLSGVINYGIFPAVTVRCFMQFCGIPDTLALGGLDIPMFPALMILELALAIALVWLGGQITILTSDFLQAAFGQVVFLVLMVFFLLWMPWQDLIGGLSLAPAGESMLHPFRTGSASDFNTAYYLIGAFMVVYTTKAWQGNSAYNSSARTPHEARMAGILANWRAVTQNLVLLLIPLCVFALLHNPKFSLEAGRVQQLLGAITDPAIRAQVTVPVALSVVLPTGLLGLLATTLVAAAISTDNTYLHSWGSIFIQDVVLPLRKKALSPEQHVRWLRLSSLAVAIFAFGFSMVFPQKDYIFMFMDVTGAIFLGGAGSAIIGGLYWRRGSTAAAWTAMITGATLSSVGIIIQQAWAGHLAPWLRQAFPANAWLAQHMDAFPFNGREIMFGAMLASLALYILVSLANRRQFDLETLLGREARASHDAESKPVFGWRERFAELLGSGHEFTRGDRFISRFTLVWTLAWWLIFVGGSLYNLAVDVPESAWAVFWRWQVGLSALLGTAATIWFMIGGFRDYRQMMRDLRARNQEPLAEKTPEPTPAALPELQ